MYVFTSFFTGQGIVTFNYIIYEYAPGVAAPIKIITPPPAGGTGDFFAVSPLGAVAVAIVATSPRNDLSTWDYVKLVSDRRSAVLR